MKKDKYVTAYTHVGVRNAWFGEEIWTTWSHHPATLTVDLDLWRDIPWYYRKVREEPWMLTVKMARLDVFIPLWLRYRAEEWWWAGLRWLGRHHIIYSSAHPSMRTRFRDLRLGRKHD